MARTFTAKDLIQLPRLSATEALVLTTELQTAFAALHKPAKGDKKAAKADPLPPPLVRSMARLAAEAKTLELVVLPTPGTDPQTKRKADRVVDNAWAALLSWLTGYCLLPVEVNPRQADALALRDLIFADGLAFTQLPYKLQWQESKIRLDALDRNGHTATIQALGGGAFLDHLLKAQADYGKALRITQTQDQPLDEDVRTKLLATLDAIRDYANRAATVADPDEPGSQEIAEALLRPLMAWESRVAGGNASAEDEVAPDAPAPAAPAPAPAPANPK